MNIQIFAREIHHQRHAQAIADKFGISVDNKLENITADYVVVFSYGDLKLINRLSKKIIFCEHGVGMYYNEQHPSYAGSLIGRESVVLRLSPNKNHADKEKETLSCPIEIIGIPKLDKYAVKNYKVKDKLQYKVAISFHFDCKVCPETRSSFGYFKSALQNLCNNFFMLGHGHPRLIDNIEHHYRYLGIPIKKNFEDEILERADVYICDNSSTIFEWLITKKPIVLLNPPFYRKEVEHKGNPRFWKHSGIGPICEKPEDLVKCVSEAIKNHKKYLPAIEEARKDVLTFLDGKCANRAYEIITNFIEKNENNL